MDTNTIIFITLFACLAGACIGTAIVLLKKTGEIKNPLLAELKSGKKVSGESSANGDKPDLESVLDKNNKMLSTWNTTEKAQNELKILQASGETQEQ